MSQTTILLVGTKDDTLELEQLLNREGVAIATVRNTHDAVAEVKRLKPRVVAIVVPQYWSSVLFLIQDIRHTPGFEEMPIYYMGELIEGGDLRALKALDVRVISIGPVPFTEVVREMINEMPR